MKQSGFGCVGGSQKHLISLDAKTLLMWSITFLSHCAQCTFAKELNLKVQYLEFVGMWQSVFASCLRPSKFP